MENGSKSEITDCVEEIDLSETAKSAVRKHLEHLDLKQTRKLLYSISDSEFKSFYEEYFRSWEEEGDIVFGWPPRETPTVFRLFRNCLNAVLANKSKAHIAASCVDNAIALHDEEGCPNLFRNLLWWFTVFLNSYIETHCRGDAELQKCSAYIGALLDSKIASLSWSSSRDRAGLWEPPEFSVCERYIETLPDTQSKIAHLREVRRDCRVYHLEVELELGEPEEESDRVYEKQAREEFMRRCDIHIERLEDEQKCEQIYSKAPENGLGKTGNDKATLDMTSTDGEEFIGKPRLTVDQFIMLMFAIGGSRIKGLDRQMVAEGLSSLTGNSVKGFIKRFSWVLPTEDDGIKKFNNQTAAYNKDVEKVCEILTKMGLTDEVTNLKKESNF